MTPTVSATEAIDRPPAFDVGLARTLAAITERPSRLPVTDTFSNAFQGTADGGALLMSPQKWSVACVSGAILLNRIGLTVWPAVAKPIHEQIAAGGESPYYSPFLAALDWMKRATGFADTRMAELLGVRRQSLSLWRRGFRISTSHRQRLLAVHDVLRRAAARFGDGEALATWLDTPTSDNGTTPSELLASSDIDHARFLAVSGPSSPWLSEAPSWVTRPAAASFRPYAERRQESIDPQDDEIAAEIGRFLEPEGANDG